MSFKDFGNVIRLIVCVYRYFSEHCGDNVLHLHYFFLGLEWKKQVTGGERVKLV